MTHNQLNEYIEHYIDKDKTQSAVMLTGAWGSGKSHYIKHKLTKYLKEKNKDCVIVSLYGIRSLNDISKAIYMELRSITLFKSNEVTETIKILGKTVLKNIAQFVPMLNLNTDISKEDLQNLYESVNLTEKLIIFEDIERSHIDIIEFLGYVNNFVEQDGVKVLLVANEKEILSLDIAEKYNKVKEKTVNDTLVFKTNFKESLLGIAENYENLKLIMETPTKFKLAVTIVENSNRNLRSFIYACQKTSDILLKGVDLDGELAEIIFFSLLKFLMKYKDNNFYDGVDYSQEHPLFDTCKNYILTHSLNENDVEILKTDYRCYKKQQEALNSNQEVEKLKSYYIKTEQEVCQIIKKIENGLISNNIELSIYGELTRLIVKVSGIVNYDTSIIKKYLVDNLKGKSKEVGINTLFIVDSTYLEGEISEEYFLLKSQMKNSLNFIQTKGWKNFDYNPENISAFNNVVYTNKLSDILRDTLVDELDIDKLIEMLEQSTASQIDEIRSVFWSIYRNNGVILYTEKNNILLNQLAQRVKELSEKGHLDKIIKLQLDYFIHNLKTFTGEVDYN